ncbi:MAG: PQQ-binding-like beta-propeller repeat protein [Candidatus Altiarchaeota archaeon]|nr:PQQ-binding-like beta-propeller repeat protein [Candidatus Altiarchaeota archaeon]
MNAWSAAADWREFHGDPGHTGVSRSFSMLPSMDISVAWNFTAGGAILSSPVSADADGDGKEEIFFGCDDGRLYALSHNGSLLWSFQTGGPVRSAPFVGLLHGNTTLQVLVGSEDGSVYALEHDGTLLWSFKTGGGVIASPMLGNITYGPRPGVIFGSRDGFLYVLHDDGTLFWKYWFGGPIVYTPSFVDFDSNAFGDVVFSTEDLVVVLSFIPFKIILSSAEYQVTTAPVVEGGHIFVGTEEGRVYDLTRTMVGVNEDVISSKHSRLYWMNHSRELEVLEGIAILNCSESVFSTPAVGDIDRNDDNGDEVAIGCDDGNLYVLGHDGNDTRLFRVTTSRPVKSSPVIAAFSWNVSDVSIVFGNDEGMLYIVNYSGYSLWSHHFGGRIFASPLVSDVNRDDYAEMVAATTDGVVYGMQSRTSVLKSQGLAYYATALGFMDNLDFDNATNYGVKALEIFERVNYSKGVDEVNMFFLDVSAKEHCMNAGYYYELKDYGLAVEEIEIANMIYFESRKSMKSECNDLLPIARSRYSFGKAEEMISLERFDEALVFAEDAKNMSTVSIDSSMVSLSMMLVERVNGLQAAKKMLGEIFLDYELNRTSGDMILGNMDLVEKSYRDSNVSLGERAYRMDVIRSELYMRNVTMLINMSQPEKANDLAVKVRDLCMQRNITDCVAMANAIIRETKLSSEANTYLAQAKKYYTATDFISANDYALKARDIFLKTGDSARLKEAEDILNRSTAMLGKKAEGPAFDIGKELSNPEVQALIVLLLIVAVIIVTQPKARVWWRGFAGRGLSVATQSGKKGGFGREIVRERPRPSRKARAPAARPPVKAGASGAATGSSDAGALGGAPEKH